MTPSEIRFEVQRARARAWCHDTAGGMRAVYRLDELPAGAEATTLVVSEPDGRTGFLSILEIPGGARLVVWTEAGTWSADEVAHRTRDHRRRYHSTAIGCAPSDP